MPLSAIQLLELPRPLLIAHRGNSAAAPENTLPAFLSAIQLGVDVVEFDVQISHDGQLVVIHDEKLDRTTNAVSLWGPTRTHVSQHNLAALRMLDAGAWYSPDFAGTRLSTLDEVLNQLAPQVALMVERKSGSASALVNCIERCHAVDRVTLQGFDWEFLAECHAINPEIVLGALGEHQLTEDHCRQAAALGARLVGWEAAGLDAGSIRTAHDHGLRVWSWTVDTPDEAKRLLAAGLDGLITNRPAAMKPWCVPAG